MLAHILHALAHVMAHLHHIWLIRASCSHYMAFQEQYVTLAPNISLHTYHLGDRIMRHRMSCYTLSGIETPRMQITTKTSERKYFLVPQIIFTQQTNDLNT